MREPFIARWPGKIPPKKVCDELATTMDLLPTLARLAGTKPPTDRIIDGKNIWPLLSAQNNAKSPHEAFYYYQMDQLQAVRSRNWKLHLPLKPKKRNWGSPEPESPLQLYDLKTDIAESNNIAEKHPDVVKQLTAYAEKARQDLGDTNHPGKNQRPAALIQNPKQLLMTPK
jgi:arylsulfatase A-like enzyme